MPGLSKSTWFFSNILEPMKRAFGKANLCCLQKNSREPCYMTNLDSILNNKGITLPTVVHVVKAMVFPGVMYGCESWIIKKTEHWRADAFKLVYKTLESPLDSSEIKPVNPKRNQPWIFILRTDAEAEAPTLWTPDAQSWLFGKDPDAGKDWGQEEKGMTEDEMVGWHHWLSGHDFEQTLGDNEVHWSLVCCSLWDQKELDTTEWLNNKAVWLMDELSTISPAKRKALGCWHAGTPVRDNRGQLVWTTVIVSFPKGSFH